MSEESKELSLRLKQLKAELKEAEREKDQQANKDEELSRIGISIFILCFF